MFFAGRLQRPPWETRARVEATVKRLDRSTSPTTASASGSPRCRRASAAFVDLWDRGLRAREEGRPGPLSQPRRRRPSRRRPIRPRIASCKVATFHDPTKEDDKLRELYDSFVKARRRPGRSAWPSTSSRRWCSTQVKALKDKGGTDVAFRVAMKDGKVAFTARALRGNG